MRAMGVTTLLLLLLLFPVVALGAAPPAPLRSDCPSWLLDYIPWHKANKFAPDANYLIYDCRDASCAGLGDRLRGILWLLRMAVHGKRVLVIRMDIPVPMQILLLPTYIDWTVPATAIVDGQARTLEPPNEGMVPLCCDFSNSTDLENYRTSSHNWIFSRTNTFEDYTYPNQPSLERYSVTAGCGLKALFQPSDQVEQVVTRHFAEMQVNPAKPYVAVHLRLWNMKGEGESTAHSLKSEERILTALMCARQMAAQCSVNLSDNPVVLITDGVHIRRRVALRLYHQLTTSSITPHHFDAPENHGLMDQHLETLADFVIMSRASGLFVDAMSGFSRLASYLGNLTALGANPCLQENQICSKYLTALDYRVPLLR